MSLHSATPVHGQVSCPSVDASVVPVSDSIVLNNCVDVHIGPKYVHTNNITINQGVSCVDLKDGIHNSVLGNTFSSVIYKGSKVHYWLHLKIIVAGLFCLLTVLVIIIILTEEPSPESEREGLRLEHNSEDYPLDKRFVQREAWGAAPPCKDLENNTLPLARVLFIHTVSSGTCNNFASCKQKVLDFQDMHMQECIDSDNTLDDIGYNFVIGSDGYIYVGIGWDKVGSHTRGSNRGSLGVAFIGDFRRDEPSPVMLNSAKVLLDFGVERSKLSKDYQLIGHCQAHSGFPYSPGVNLLKHIHTWSHWNDTNVKQCANFNYTL